MKTRDWLFTIVLLLLSEYILFNWTYSFGSDKNLLDHLSFAGTIVSTLLAVIAIFYGFLQSESQNRSSAQIASQISSLKDVVKDIDLSKDKFSGELDRIGEIVTKLDVLDSHIGESNKGIVDLTSKIETLKREEERPIQKSNDVVTIIDVNVITKVIGSTLDTYLLSYCLKLSVGKDYPENDLIFDRFAKPLAELAQADNNGDYEKWRETFSRRSTMAILAMRVFRSLDLLTITGNNDVVTLSKQFVDVLNATKFDAVLSSGDFAKYKNAIETKFP